MGHQKTRGPSCDRVSSLEIPNMTEEEFLFNFIDNLQEWAEQELRCQGVQWYDRGEGVGTRSTYGLGAATRCPLSQPKA